MKTLLGSYFYTLIILHEGIVLSSERLGKFVNDSPNKWANAVIKITYIQGNPHLFLYAKKDINPGEEIRYDYGAPGLWWRKNVSFYC